MKVFPRLTKCTFHRFGSSGDVQKHDAMCILPINIINEKIYVFLWFWFYMVALVSVFAVIYRLFVYLMRPMRVYITSSRSKLVNERSLANVVSRLSIGDWFMIDLLAKNMASSNFRDFIAALEETKPQAATNNHEMKEKQKQAV